MSFFFDQLKATCPADANCARQLDAALADDEDGASNEELQLAQVAACRSNNSETPAFVRDDFLASAKEAATETRSVSVPPSVAQEKFEPRVTLANNEPVATARLQPSEDPSGEAALASVARGRRG